LHLDRAYFPRGAQALERDALVRRMLIDDHHLAVALADEVTIEDLADDAKIGKPFFAG